MNTMSRFFRVFVLAAATALLIAAGGDRRPAPPNPLTDYQEYTRRALQQRFPNVSLITQDKKQVRFYDDVIKGRIVILQFMFTNCEKYCPMVTPNLVKVQRELKQRGAGDIEFVSITVDPVHDTPAVLKRYAEDFHVQDGWRFLTGRKADIDHIRRELGVWDPEEKKVEHMNVLTIGNEATAQWFAIEALAKPGDIVQTALRFKTTLAGAGHSTASAVASSSSVQHKVH